MYLLFPLICPNRQQKKMLSNWTRHSQKWSCPMLHKGGQFLRSNAPTQFAWRLTITNEQNQNLLNGSLSPLYIIFIIYPGRIPLRRIKKPGAGPS
jgi:hypothetical protein